MIRGLVAIAALIPMTTHVEHCWEALTRTGSGRAVEIARDVQPGTALVVNQLNREALSLKLSGGGDLERSLLGEGPQAQHFEVLLPVLREPLFPLLLRFYRGQEAIVDPLGLLSEVGLDHCVSRLIEVGFAIGLSGRTEKTLDDDPESQAEAAGGAHVGLVS